MKFPLVSLVIAATAFVCSAGLPARAQTPTETSGPAAVWSPYGTRDALTEELMFAAALLERGLPDLAAERLTRIDGSSLASASPETVCRFGALSIRAVMETARLSDSDGRARAEAEIAEIRNRAPNAAFGKDAPQESLAYELAYVRALYALGVLADEGTAPQNENAETESAIDPDASRLLKAAAARARECVETLPNAQARPFLYWAAKAALADRADPRRFETADKLALALENASRQKLDEYCFYARLLLVESARRQGKLELASSRIRETLDALKRASGDGAPVEAALGLAAEETRLLADEGKAEESLRTAAQDVDLLDAPYPPNLGRFTAELPDLFSELNLARAQTFWTASETARDEKDGAPISNAPSKQALVDAARTASNALQGNFWRTRGVFLAQAAGANSDDWQTVEASADANFADGNYGAAVQEYDRAAEGARDAGANDDAYRLAGTAAGVVDKICREKLFDAADSPETNGADAWESNARDRFAALAKARPNEELAPQLYLLALEHAENAQTPRPELDAMRAEYLELFPTAPNRAAFALQLARGLLASDNLDGAADALDAVPEDAPEFPDALETERKLYAARMAQTPSAQTFAAAIGRLVNRASFMTAEPVDSTAALANLIAECAQKTTAQTLQPADSRIFALALELAIAEPAGKAPELVEPIDALLERWEAAERDRTALAKIRSLRLARAVDVKSPEELMALLSSFDGGAEDAALDAVVRLTDAAENAPQANRARIAQFALDALEKIRRTAANADRADLARADALRLLGKSQDALNLYAKLRKKDPKNAQAVRGIALLLSSQQSVKTLEQGIKYWTDYADLQPLGSPEWWDAKERCVEIYCRIGKSDQAQKMLKTLWLTRSDPSDPGRKARWEKIIADTEKNSR